MHIRQQHLGICGIVACALVELFRYVFCIYDLVLWLFFGMLCTSIERGVLLLVQHAHAQQLVELGC